MSEVSLLDLVKLTTGKLNSNAAVPDGKYPFFTCSVETYRINSFSFDTEALLLAGNNAEGNFSLKYYKGKFDAYQRTYVLTLEDENTTTYKYIFYSLKTRLAELKNNSAGSATRFLTLSILKDIKIQLPPLPEQKAIADVLSALDDKIDLLQRQNETLEQMAETLFRQWFIEEAKEDWENTPISQLFEVRDGTHDSPKQTSYGFPLITSKHLHNGNIDINSAYLISKEDFDKVNQRSLVESFDILYSMIGTLGLVFLEQNLHPEYAIKNVGLFKTSQNKSWSYYVYLWLISDNGKAFIEENKSGSTQEYISLGSLRKLEIQKPPMKKLHQFNDVVSPLFDKNHINKQQIQTLQNIRDTLLPKLMSGEVRVKFD